MWRPYDTELRLIPRAPRAILVYTILPHVSSEERV